MQFYQKRTAEQQAARLPLDLRERYLASQIDRITISAGTKTINLTGYAEYSFFEEKSYTTQPVRTLDGKIEDIDEYETFLTPRLIIKYSMMNIDDYRETMKLFKKHNAFIVRCYDVVEDKIIEREMYVAPSSMPTIYKQYLIAMGIQEFTIELIGTNRTNDFSVTYSDEDLFEKFSAPLGSTWRTFVDEISYLDIQGNSVILKGDSETNLYYSNGRSVHPDDKIIDGEAYYLEWG